MTISVSLPTSEFELSPRITVVGVGGAGGNAVNNMIESNLEGVEFVVANTDSQALANSKCNKRIQLGVNITRGLGAGSRPEVGHAAAEETMDDVMQHLQGSNMVFVTGGMGGGTGTGAAPVIARAAREAGILTVGVVTKPFHFEGAQRMRKAEAGLEELQKVVDTLIIIPNQNLFRIANEKTTFADAFNMADDVLYSGVRGITDLMVMPGLVNLDFADIRTVMMEMGKAMMGTGEGEGEGRAVTAAEAAISNPLLDDVSMKGAQGVLINITGGMDMTLFEIDEAANRIREEVDNEANIIFGSTFDQSMEGVMRVSIVATGIENEGLIRPEAPVMPSSVAQPKGISTPFGPLGAPYTRTSNASAPNPFLSASHQPQPEQPPVQQEKQQTNTVNNQSNTSYNKPAAQQSSPAPATQAVNNPSHSKSNNNDAFVAPTVERNTEEEVLEAKQAGSFSNTQNSASSNNTNVQAKAEDVISDKNAKNAAARPSFVNRFKSGTAQPGQVKQEGGVVPENEPVQQASSNTAKPSEAEKEDLDIPAFLRRKKG